MNYGNGDEVLTSIRAHSVDDSGREQIMHIKLPQIFWTISSSSDNSRTEGWPIPTLRPFYGYLL
jgi:hypothetical protein